ncbi:MAG: 50S ribosomal protein L11 methyltransferase [Pseudomonadales bacterium]|uniref:Methyltransferase n=1 Tax=Oleiphilus messinensis TaxID=141451 RepID=A0A1Y0IH99_9GAMM|nr:50S ribosomal protein L11 methyltransferase [Oleiphilus messinensis]ARU58764.1 methyltransferase [Oleiphilus messinensis]MCG8613207.1 50S ribosomal protein L11 methyltransferase [Pseudomonadales bacterium]
MVGEFRQTEAKTDLSLLLDAIRVTLPRADLKPYSLPGCPQLSLYLFDPDVMHGPLTHDEAQAVVAEPAYWSFCWASGQALASYIMDHPEWVRGRRCLDFGAGSGVAGIAAALAGAAEVIACDLDQDALLAAKVNAALNGVSLKTECDFFKVQGEIDVILAADVLYDRENLTFLDAFCSRAQQVVLADSRIKNLSAPGYELQEVYTCRTWPDLNEFEEFNRVRIYCAGEKK